MRTLRKHLMKHGWGELIASEVCEEYREGGIEAVDNYACEDKLVDAVRCWEEKLNDFVELIKRT